MLLSSTLLGLFAAAASASAVTVAAPTTSTLCITMDEKLKLVSPLDSTISYKLDVDMCMCVTQGVLTPASLKGLKAAVDNTGLSTIGNKLGLNILNLGDTILQLTLYTVAETAAQLFVNAASSMCTYPAGAVPNSCTTCAFSCSGTLVKCNKKCIQPTDVCPTKAAAPATRRGARGLHELPAAPRAIGHIGGRRRRGLLAGEDDTLDISGSGPDGSVDASSDGSGLVSGTKGALNADAQELLKMQAEAQKGCALGLTLCSLGQATGSGSGLDRRGWACKNTTQDLESCGGCLFPISTGPVGIDCSSLPTDPGTSSMTCINAKCTVTCKPLFKPNAEGTACVKATVAASVGSRSGNGL